MVDNNNMEDISYHFPRLIRFEDSFAARGLQCFGFYIKIQRPKSVDLTFIIHDIISCVYLWTQKNKESNSDNNKCFIQIPQGNIRTKNLVPHKTHSIHASGSALQKLVFLIDIPNKQRN